MGGITRKAKVLKQICEAGEEAGRGGSTNTNSNCCAQKNSFNPHKCMKHVLLKF